MPSELTTPNDPGPLWVDGEFWLNVRDRGTDRLVHVQRPYGLLGRLEGADVSIDDRSVSARHVYLHLDARGLYAVDLSSRTGTRLPAVGQLAAWIDPGEEFEVAGRAIRLLDYRIHHDRSGTEPECPRTDLLALGDPQLIRLTLYPVPARESPRSLDSELVFAGRGATCGVRIEGASASRVHLALVRTRTSAYAVDLLGRGTRLNDRIVPGATPLIDGDFLTLGVARFRVGAGDPPEITGLPAVHRTLTGEVLPRSHVPLDPTALAGLIMRLVQAGQEEAFRRQDEFQMNLVQMIHQMQMDNATVLSEHLKRIEKVNLELAALKEEIARRLAPAPTPSRPGRPGITQPPVSPLKINPAAAPPTDPGTATDWLISRVSQLEEESRSSWKDLLGRLSGGVR